MDFEAELEAVVDDCLDTFGRERGNPLLFHFEDRPIRYHPEDETIRQELILGGLVDDTDKVIRCRKRDLGTELPTEKQSVLIDGQRYKIRSVATSQGDPEARLILSLPNRRS